MLCDRKMQICIACYEPSAHSPFALKGDEEGFGLRKLAALTLALMSVFSFLYFLLTRCRDHENGVTYEEPSSNKESGTMFSNMDNNNKNSDVSYNRDRNNNKRKGGIFA